jgi:hypothetical protein
MAAGRRVPYVSNESWCGERPLLAGDEGDIAELLGADALGRLRSAGYADRTDDAIAGLAVGDDYVRAARRAPRRQPDRPGADGVRAAALPDGRQRPFGSKRMQRRREPPRVKRAMR